MKLLSLNAFGATQGQVFFDYIKEQAGDTDIFCLQEICSASGNTPKTSGNAHMYGFEELCALLPDFAAFFEPKSSGYAYGLEQAADWPVNLGMAVFVRKNLEVLSYAGKIIGDSAAMPGSDPIEGLIKTQVLTLKAEASRFSVINMHGLSRPGDKLDTPQRIAQSQCLLDIIGSLPKAPVVLCGDFNLMPETESIKMLEDRLKNLIKTYNITNTRNEISWKKYNNRQNFADFTFVSSEIKVKDFEVPYNLVSDHLPMILEFEI